MKNLFLLIALCSCGLTDAQVLTEASPESVSMSTERLARIDNAVADALEKKWFPGAAVLIARQGKIIFYKAYGMDDLEGQKPLKKDGLFRIASQTKAITSVAVMMLFEEGKLSLDDPLSKFIPEFKSMSILKTFNPKDSSYTAEKIGMPITLRHLLTHTSGIDYPVIGSREFQAIYAKAKIPTGLEMPYATLDDKIRALAKLPLRHLPGERWTYGLSVDVLGRVVEIVSGERLDQFFHERIFEPLGMNDTYFYLPKEKQRRLVTLYAENNQQLVKLTGEKGLNPMYPNAEGTYFAGGSGLTSTLEDYAKFLQMLIENGRYNGHQLLSRKTVELMTTCQTPEMKMQFGLGFQLETFKNDGMSPQSIGSFSWGGAFSTMYWGDPVEKLVGVVYEQVSNSTHSDLNNQIKTLVYQAITD